MCLVVLAFGSHPGYPLVVTANRDEFHARPARDAGWWPDWPDVAGGRDLLAGGTWLAVHRDGRFATVTNHHDAEPKHANRRSRGELVTGFLQGDAGALDYLQSIDGNSYDGFNLLVGDRRELAYLSNQDNEPRTLTPGIYGLANARLDSPCDKVQRSRKRLQGLLEASQPNDTGLFRLLADRRRGPVAEAADKHLPFARAHATTAPFIVLPDYGTRCSTIFTVSGDGHAHFRERRFDPAGNSVGETTLEFDIDRPGLTLSPAVEP